MHMNKIFLLSLLFLLPNIGVAQPAVDADSGLAVNLWAGEDLVQNPVCFTLDEQGRMYVGESFRQSKGIEDNRSHGYWLIDDLKSMTVDDRLAAMKKWSDAGKKPFASYSEFEDRITRIEDSDGDGKADKRSIFADGFNGPLDGTGAGLIARRGKVWYNCIPNLWQMEDKDDDGVSDTRKSLSSGHGVRWALRGHDSHGLTWGPDGRLYWSIGDRGYKITTKEGKTFHDPGTGAVFRHEPDGSNLEVYFRGLRNPQELTFDVRGNLFTGDNNSDAGDQARIMYLPEGGWMGWQMAYQTLDGDYSRGPWHMDKLWHTQHKNQPAWIIPALAHISNGPSGLTFYPGIGLPERYDNHMFMADFKGGAAASYIWSWECKPKGAGFECVDPHHFVKNILVTDVEFGMDGKMYASDWVEGWVGINKGKIWTIDHPESRKNPAVAGAATMFANIDGMASDKLAELLRHPDYRVRQRAQFVLAERGMDSVPHLIAATKDDNPLTRLHGIWGIGQVVRYTGNAGPCNALAPLLDDADNDVVVQTVKVLGESEATGSASKLKNLLKHESPRVKMFAAQELGRLGVKDATEAIMQVLRDNADEDVFLRHGCVMGLTWMNDADLLLKYADDENRSARLGALLALRRHGETRIARFLQDDDPFLVAEAARAIYDVPIESALPALAQALAPAEDTFVRRSIAANYLVGGAGEAKRLADFAAENGGEMGAHALDVLAFWKEPPEREPVHGHYKEVAPRDTEMVKTACAPHIDKLMAGDAALQKAAIKIARDLKLPLGDAQFSAIAFDASKPIENRQEAINTLGTKGGKANVSILVDLLDDKHYKVRAAAMMAMVKPAPDRALQAANRMLNKSTTLEQQHAFAALAALENEAADEVLKTWSKKLVSGKVENALKIDLIDAAKARGMTEQVAAYEATLDATDPLAKYRPALDGGDAQRGAVVFKSHQAAQCARCHAVDAGHETAMIGPNIHDVAKRLNAEKILESVVAPNAVVAEGFGLITLSMNDGTVHAGTIRSEKDGLIEVQPLEGKAFSVKAADVKTRTNPVSSMPPMGLILQPKELRDVVAYLRTLTK